MADKKFFNPEMEAKSILEDHTSAFLNVACHDEDIVAMTIDELFEETYDECAYILTQRFLDGEYNIKEYYLVRNALAKLLDQLIQREDYSV